MKILIGCEESGKVRNAFIDAMAEQWGAPHDYDDATMHEGPACIRCGHEPTEAEIKALESQS